MNKIFKFSAISLAVIVLGLGSINMVDAFQGKNSNTKEKVSQNKVKPNHRNKNHQEISESLDNHDYDTWKELSKNTLIADRITEENFDQIIEIHKLKRAGEFEEARNLSKELGLPIFSNQKRMNRGQKKHRGPGFIDENNNGICDKME